MAFADVGMPIVRKVDWTMPKSRAHPLTIVEFADVTRVCPVPQHLRTCGRAGMAGSEAQREFERIGLSLNLDVE